MDSSGVQRGIARADGDFIPLAFVTQIIHILERGTTVGSIVADDGE